MKTWAFNPHVGGRPIPPSVKRRTVERLEKHAADNYQGLYTRLGIRFRGPLCYVDAFTEPEKPDKRLLSRTHETPEAYLERMRNWPLRLGRLRYFAEDRWSYAFYTYSNERYEPTVFVNGDWFGTPEEAFDIGAVYLHGK